MSTNIPAKAATSGSTTSPVPWSNPTNAGYPTLNHAVNTQVNMNPGASQMSGTLSATEFAFPAKELLSGPMNYITLTFSSVQGGAGPDNTEGIFYRINMGNGCFSDWQFEDLSDGSIHNISFTWNYEDDGWPIIEGSYYGLVPPFQLNSFFVEIYADITSVGTSTGLTWFYIYNLKLSANYQLASWMTAASGIVAPYYGG